MLKLRFCFTPIISFSAWFGHGTTVFYTNYRKKTEKPSILNIHTATVKVCRTLLKVEFIDRTVQVCFVGKLVYIANTVKSPPTNNETKNTII